MMAITDLTTLLRDVDKLGKLDAAGEARYDQLRSGVEAAIKAYCKWEIEAVAGQVDYYDGEDQPELVLRRPYVSAVTEVRLDNGGYYGQAPNGFGSTTVLTNGEDYALKYDGDVGGSGIGRSGLLMRLSSNLNLFPSDFFFFRQSGGLSYCKPLSWPEGHGNLKVTYNYGFSAANMPADLKLAVSTAVSIITNTVKYGWPVSSESLTRYSYSLSISKDAEFGTVRQLLSRYRDTSM